MPNNEKYCKWKKADFGMFGVPSYEYYTSCGKNYDCNKIKIENYCPNCGNRTSRETNS